MSRNDVLQRSGDPRPGNFQVWGHPLAHRPHQHGPGLAVQHVRLDIAGGSSVLAGGWICPGGCRIWDPRGHCIPERVRSAQGAQGALKERGNHGPREPRPGSPIYLVFGSNAALDPFELVLCVESNTWDGLLQFLKHCDVLVVSNLLLSTCGWLSPRRGPCKITLRPPAVPKQLVMHACMIVGMCEQGSADTSLSLHWTLLVRLDSQSGL